MVKTIILFSDGTGNSSASLFKTNVFRIYDALDMTPDKGQIAYYDDGVGSSQHRWWAALTGAFGFGLKRNVLDLYKFLTRHYACALKELKDAYGDPIPAEKMEELPRIACFGFSRGAFTIRLLIGLVNSQGLPVHADSEAELDRFAERAYRKLRSDKFHTKHGLEKYLRRLRDYVISHVENGDAQTPGDKRPNFMLGKNGIEFLGLWDTVGAYGMPIEELRVVIDRYVFPMSFPSYDLLPMVKITRHALSIDDERDAFTPIPFDDADARRESEGKRYAIEEALVDGGMDREEAKEAAHDAVSEPSRQVWFAGVHANVGGGYPDDSLAMAPLRWIMLEAQKHGVVFRARVLEDVSAKSTAFGQMHDSRSGLNALYRYMPRDIAGLLRNARQLTLATKDAAVARANHEPEQITPLIHESVIYRMALRFDGYAPIALPPKFNVVDDAGRVRDFIDFTADARKRAGRFARDSAASSRGKASALAEAVAKLKRPDPECLGLVKAAVFWRRVMYQVTIWSLILLALTPLLDEDDAAPNSLLTQLFSGIVGFVAGYLPGFLSPWLDAFRQHPWVSGCLVAIFIVSYLWGASLKRTIADRSRAAWGMKICPQSGFARALWDPIALALLACPAATRFWNGFANHFVPGLLVFASFLFLIVAVDRLMFHFLSYRGEICRSENGAGNLTTLEAEKGFTFRTNEPCQPSGLKLQKGRAYLAHVAIAKEWFDDRHLANLDGVDRSQLDGFAKVKYFLGGLGARRKFGQRWFKPIFRVGADGFGEFAVNPTVPFSAESGKKTMDVRFKSPADGELFVYVNDAYGGFIPWALLFGQSGKNKDGSWMHAYDNNSGEAEITVRPLKPEEYGD